MTVIYINDEFLPEEQAKISVYDHGLLYGDGVFEGIRAYNKRIFKLEEHVDRLYESSNAIDLKIPMSRQELCRKIIETCRKNEVKDGYIRVVVTRGVGDLGLDPRKCKAPTIIIIAKSIALYPHKEGLTMITTTIRRTPPQSLSPNIKSLNYLNNILARIEANHAGADEALFLDTDGYVSEASADNIFYVKGNLVTTPPTATNLKGITRATVLELAKELGYDTRVTLFTLFDIYNADEVFLTGTAAEIEAVIKIDGRIIGEGKPGKVTKHLIQSYRELVNSTGTPIYE
ncbi:MAG: branched-chain-amino-acid transaminase [Candidatus Thermoplasmatota archaeon]|nr:branched-chain-amino-acid transaminase [Candidatus Thermoplasmatota archaeon]